MSGEALWRRLRAASLVDGDMPVVEAGPPWFVRLMLGIAGWLGAIFLLAFVGIGFAALMRSATAGIAAGAAVCTAAVFLFRLGARGDLVGQFTFAVSLAGQGLVLVGLGNAFARSDGFPALCFALLQAVLFALAPNFLHRVWTAGSGAYALAYALGQSGLGTFAPAALTGAFVAVWLPELERARRSETLRAAGYGIAGAVLAAMAEGAMRTRWGVRPQDVLLWAGAIASGAVFLAAAVLLLRREGVPPGSARGRVALVGALIIALAAVKAPWLGAATAILVLGYANGNRPLAGFGAIAMIAYLSHYYYSLQATLLEKSALLAAAGIALLLARFALQRAWPAQEAGDA